MCRISIVLLALSFSIQCFAIDDFRGDAISIDGCFGLNASASELERVRQLPTENMRNLVMSNYHNLHPPSHRDCEIPRTCYGSLAHAKLNLHFRAEQADHNITYNFPYYKIDFKKNLTGFCVYRAKVLARNQMTNTYEEVMPPYKFGQRYIMELEIAIKKQSGADYRTYIVPHNNEQLWGRVQFKNAITSIDEN